MLGRPSERGGLKMLGRSHTRGKGPERSNPSEGVVGRCLGGPMALPFNDTLRHKGGLIERAPANPPEGLADEIFINPPHRRQKSGIFFNQSLRW